MSKDFRSKDLQRTLLTLGTKWAKAWRQGYECKEVVQLTNWEQEACLGGIVVSQKLIIVWKTILSH